MDDKQTIECPECMGKGKFNRDDTVCQPCQGTGQLDFDGVCRLFIEARRAALRRSDREREWRRIAKKKEGLWNWLRGNSCNPKCRRSKKTKDNIIRKQGNTIRYYRRIIEDHGIDLMDIRYPTTKRGSIKNT